jgi:hypothetical protein
MESMKLQEIIEREEFECDCQKLRESCKCKEDEKFLKMKEVDVLIKHITGSD